MSLGGEQKSKRKNKLDSGNEWQHVGVSKNRGTPTWMVYNENPYSNG